MTVEILKVLKIYCERKSEIEFFYKNYKGDVSKRYVRTMHLYWGKTEYHPKEQWLLEAYDLLKKDIRHFAVVDIQNTPKDIGNLP